MPSHDALERTFRYHSPTRAAVTVHERIRTAMTAVTLLVARCLPTCREAESFVSQMQQAQMMANAAIAIHGLPAQAPSHRQGAAEIPPPPVPFVAADPDSLLMARPLVAGAIALMAMAAADIEAADRSTAGDPEGCPAHVEAASEGAAIMDYLRCLLSEDEPICRPPECLRRPHHADSADA